MGPKHFVLEKEENMEREKEERVSEPTADFCLCATAA